MNSVTVSSKQTALLFGDKGIHRNRLTEERQHEDPVVADPKLIGVAEVISGREFIILERTQKQTRI